MKRAWVLFVCIASSTLHGFSLPTSFDLRDVSGTHFVSRVKKQSGGTCWTHGVMAAMEGNLMRSGNWRAAGESGDPELAEYHLDWWNGFNEHHNADISPDTGGLTVHQGGDYRVAAAYLSRGSGAVRSKDGQSYSEPPEQHNDNFHYYYPRDIEWFSSGDNLEHIDKIKTVLQETGVVGTALTWSSSYYSSSSHTFYQPLSSSAQPNHAVAIVGWDDNMKTRAPNRGAWLIKNSWGKDWGDGGFFWISYYDKVAGKHPEMGAVSFRNVERMRYHHVYFHDYHGWRDTMSNASEAFNAFVGNGRAGEREILKAASFYTAVDNVHFSIVVFDRFDGELKDALSYTEGTIAHTGFHTVDFDWPVVIKPGRKFYIYLHLSDGGHAFDKTSNVPVLLGAVSKPIVESRAHAGESFYRSGSSWVDLTSHDATANFCIKGLSLIEDKRSRYSFTDPYTQMEEMILFR